jgi:molybdate transport system ATP-binding protein
LSGGEKQRVALARALLSAPRILLMDEPLSGLDDARRIEIMGLIERVRDEFKIPIIYVTHTRDEVRRLATRVVRLNAGRVEAIGNASDLLEA